MLSLLPCEAPGSTAYVPLVLLRAVLRPRLPSLKAFVCLFLHLLQSQNLKATFSHEMTFVSQIGTSTTAYPAVQLILAIL